MMSHAGSVAAGQVLECDLCIVGAGAAGLTLALELAGKGLKVMVLEAGGEKFDKDLQAQMDGEIVNPAHAPAHMYRQRRLGGSTAIWGGRCVPFDDIDFEARDYVPLSGWPFGRQALDPYYERAQTVLEAGAFDYDAATALGDLEFVQGFKDGQVQTRGIERFSAPTNFWKRYRTRLLASDNVTILTRAAAVGFSARGGHVDAVRCVGPGGGAFSVRARRFVVAAGGLETVRLLGHSRLGDHSGMLGRTYMCHVESSIGQLRLNPANRPIQYGFERTRDGIYARRRFGLSQEFQRSRRVLNSIVRLHHPSVVDPAHGHPVLSAMFLTKRFIIPDYARKFAVVEHAAGASDAQSAAFWGRHLGNIVRGAPAMAAFTFDWVRRRYLSYRRVPYVALPSAEGVYPLDYNGEQAPNRDSRVMLSNALDANGVPKLKIDWRLSELDRLTLATTLKTLRGAVESSGVGAIEFDDETLDQVIARDAMPVGGHHIGTARMSTDPAAGVVDADCRVHQLDNLYVAGCAAFPTSSHANPTLTIVAMAIRLADHLEARLRV